MRTHLPHALVASLAVALPVPLHSVWQRPSHHSRDELIQPVPSAPTAPAPTATTPTTSPVRAHRRAHVRRRRQIHRRLHRVVVAFPAGDPGTTISDFKFSPATITVHTGQTVTWVNRGPSTHTATARDRSFDSGPLKPGAGSSHTFTQAGTYQYFCKIHPFMHGTVVVLAAASAPTPAKSKNSPTAAAAAPAAAPHAAPPAKAQPTLPVTGLDIPATVATAVLLLLGGVVLRSRSRSRR